MKPEIIESRAPRTYPLPKKVIECASRARDRAHAYKVQVSRTADFTGAILAGGGAITKDMISVLSTIRPPEVAHQMPPTKESLEWDMFGGDGFAFWCDRIMQEDRSTREKVLTASLEAVDYSDRYRYLGITAPSETVVVRGLVRAPLDDPAVLEEWAHNEWVALNASSLAGFQSFVLDRELVGMTAAALQESHGLTLMFEEPQGWLPFRPIVAAPLPDEIPAGAHTYAVVAPTDHTAVMNVVQIAPGPIVKARDGGKWIADDKLYGELLSMTPPPLVELDPPTLEMVLAQIDGDKVAAASEDPNYVEAWEDGEPPEAADGEAGAEDTEEKPAEEGSDDSSSAEKPKAVVEEKEDVEEDKDTQEAGNENPLKETPPPVAASGLLDDIHSLVRNRDHILEHMCNLEEPFRRDLVNACDSYNAMVRSRITATSNDLRTRLAALELSANAVVVASGTNRYRGISETSGRYWNSGDGGAVKITWGVRKVKS